MQPNMLPTQSQSQLLTNQNQAPQVSQVPQLPQLPQTPPTPLSTANIAPTNSGFPSGAQQMGVSQQQQTGFFSPSMTGFSQNAQRAPINQF